jgi:hypothetical protein
LARRLKGRFLLLELAPFGSQKESGPERLRSGAVYKADMGAGQYDAFRHSEK